MTREPTEQARSLPIPRRSLLQAVAGAGIGLGALPAATRIAGATPSDKAGQPELNVSSPACEEIQLNYVNGKASLTVYVYGSGGSEYDVVKLSKASPVQTLSGVPEGEYTIEAKPGDEFDDDDTENSGVIVHGSPVTVESCVPSVQAKFICTTLNGNPVSRLSLTNPYNTDVLVGRTTFSGSREFPQPPVTVPGGGTVSGGTFVADGRFGVELTAELIDGNNTSVPVNGELVFRKVLDCR